MIRLLSLGAAFALASCASPVKLQNVAGTWSCPRVDGVCATTEALDRQLTDAAPAPVMTAQSTELVNMASPDAGTMGRSYDQVARIVFAPLVDDQGHYHEARVVHAVMARGSWLPAPARTPDTGEGEE
ncbi:TraV family lipoprotein [Parvularcula sp. ZS-1/3]|uniref:TraV family lipoprotein n=1 Tax=Parvularcula mediterranea TaxID=2732508 RepID=A0A7Y3RNV3_9PROT|nr:TraV family lipoprotein [Parvularcula mediterranea]NNU17493.1 TraV family lipoprotein [Parvularcula mediterranea]